MKKLISLVVSVLLLATALCTLVACGGTDGTTEKIDTTKTQLYVYNFDGGYGTDWLNTLKARFEELHKDDTNWEEGKKGVQVIVTPKKEGIASIADKVLDNREEVYFTEYAQYYELMDKGILGDITSAVTADLSAYGDNAGTTIESKLTDEQKAYYGIEKDGQTKYYGLPHYSGYYGIIYNVDVFDARGYYFVDGYDKNSTDIVSKFIYVDPATGVSAEKRTAGPDGVYDTSDDGLPATYEEFWTLCEYISGGGEVPLVWSGHDYTGYLQALAHCLAIDYEGKEQSMLNYTLGQTSQSNVANTLGEIKNGKFVRDAEPTTIALNNATEVFRQEGKYQSLVFLEDLIRQTKYQDTRVFNSAFSHMNAQDEFLLSGNDGTSKQIAMLVDGIWWESEATNTFNKMVAKNGEEFSKMNRNFAFMPLPKADEDHLGGQTLYDHIYSMCFMKSNVAEWKQPLALDFIKFVNSNQSLVEFTQITNTPKALQYSLTDEQMAQMSNFGRSVIALQQKSDIVYPFSNTATYVNFQSKFTSDGFYSSKVGSTEYANAPLAFHENPVTAEQFFAGQLVYYNEEWAELMGS